MRLRHRNAHMRMIRPKPFGGTPKQKAMMLAEHCEQLCYTFSDYEFARSCHARSPVDPSSRQALLPHPLLNSSPTYPHA